MVLAFIAVGCAAKARPEPGSGARITPGRRLVMQGPAGMRETGHVGDATRTDFDFHLDRGGYVIVDRELLRDVADEAPGVRIRRPFTVREVFAAAPPANDDSPEPLPSLSTLPAPIRRVENARVAVFVGTTRIERIGLAAPVILDPSAYSQTDREALSAAILTGLERRLSRAGFTAEIQESPVDALVEVTLVDETWQDEKTRWLVVVPAVPCIFLTALLGGMCMPPERLMTRVIVGSHRWLEISVVGPAGVLWVGKAESDSEDGDVAALVEQTFAGFPTDKSL